MGYSTEFSGVINIKPPLNEKEIEFLRKFNDTRRMTRNQGPYYVEDESEGYGYLGVNMNKGEHNQPPPDQPGLWCHWVSSDHGRFMLWDAGEKTYDFAEWMKYLIEHFVCSNPNAKSELPFLQSHVLNGTIEAKGEEGNDRWDLIVRDNKVFVRNYEFKASGEEEV